MDMEKKKLKKTKYSFMYSSTVYKGFFRRVWQDENGEYFIKRDGNLENVSDYKENFIED